MGWPRAVKKEQPRGNGVAVMFCERVPGYLKMFIYNIVTYRPTARQRLGKHTPAEWYAQLLDVHCYAKDQ
jgi:hypothetical protein